MNTEAIEFMKLDVEDRAFVITDMVRELSKETGQPIDVCIAIIAEYKNCSVFAIEQYIKKCDPDLLYQVAFYNGETKVYKYTIDKEVKDIAERKLLPLVLNHPFEVDSVFIRKTIEEFCSC